MYHPFAIIYTGAELDADNEEDSEDEEVKSTSEILIMGSELRMRVRRLPNI